MGKFSEYLNKQKTMNENIVKDIFAVAHGIDKTIIYVIPHETMINIAKDCIKQFKKNNKLGDEFWNNEIIKKYKLVPKYATNSSSEEDAEKAEEMEEDNDYWLNLYEDTEECLNDIKTDLGI